MIILFSFVFSSCQIIYAQDISPQEIKAQLKELRSNPEFDSKDTLNISLINDLCLALRFKNLDTVLILGQEALKLSKANGYKRGEARSLISIASFYSYSGKPKTAIQFANQSLNISLKNNFFLQEAKAFNVLGKVYLEMSDYPNSYKSFMKGADAAKKMNSKEYVIVMNMNIGTMFSLIGDHQQALKYYDKALIASNHTKEESRKWQIKSNIAYLQSNVGTYDEALININESINYFEKTHLKQWLAFATTTKAGIFLKQDRFENAHVYYQKAKSIHNSLQDGKGKADVSYGLAASYFGLNEIEYAEKIALESLEMYQDMQLKTGIQKAYTTLYKINESKNNSIKALSYLKLADALSDTIALEVNKTNLQMLSVKLDFQKEKELLQEQSEAKIAKQLSITRWTVFALFASLLFGFIIHNANKRVKRLNKLLNDKTSNLERKEFQLRELNTTQEKLFSIIGHDLKGPMTSLKELLKTMSIEDDNSKIIQGLLPKLKNYTTHVHFTLENLLNWGENQMKGEVVTPSRINLHLASSKVIALLSEAILKKELNLELHIDQEIFAWADQEDLNVIFRNLLSNAIKFTNPKGHIQITAKLNVDKVLVEFIDSGVGMSLETQKLVFETNQHYSTFGTSNEKGTGMGLMLIKDLLLRNNGKIEVKSHPNRGSNFSVYLPTTAGE